MRLLAMELTESIECYREFGLFLFDYSIKEQLSDKYYN